MKILVSIFILLASSTLPVKLIAAGDEGGFAAKVNNDFITVSDYEKTVESLVERDGTHVASNELKKEAINKLVDEYLLRQKAESLDIQVDADELKKGLAEIRSRFEKDVDGEVLTQAEAESSFQAELKKEGIIYSEFKERIKKQLIVKKLIDRKITKTGSQKDFSAAVDRYIAALRKEASIHVYLYGLSDKHEKTASESSNSNTQLETGKKASYAAIAAALVNGCEGTNKAIAVLGFSYSDGHESNDGNVVAERIVTELVKVKKVKVIERKEIEKVFIEIKLQHSGIINSDSAKEIGKMVGADWVVVGTLTELKDAQLELNARMVGVESSEILNAVSRRIEKDWTVGITRTNNKHKVLPGQKGAGTF